MFKKLNVMNHTTIRVLALVAALAALVATGIVAMVSPAAASGHDSTISLHAKNVQKQKCQKASCTESSTITNINNGGIVSTS
jgi:hypothetical protein